MLLSQYSAELYLGSETPLKIKDASPEETQRIENMLKNGRTFTVRASVGKGSAHTITINGAAVPWWYIDAGEYAVGQIY